MKYPYIVKANGRYYSAGSEVPSGASAPKADAKPKSEPKDTEKKDGK